MKNRHSNRYWAGLTQGADYPFFLWPSDRQPQPIAADSRKAAPFINNLSFVDFKAYLYQITRLLPAASSDLVWITSFLPQSSLFQPPYSSYFKFTLMNIFVGNLSSQTTEQHLTAQFSPFGIVRNCKIVTDNYTGRSRGFAFVEMPVDAEAERAIRDLNGTAIDSQSIVVNEARPRVERERFSRSRY